MISVFLILLKKGVMVPFMRAKWLVIKLKNGMIDALPVMQKKSYTFRNESQFYEKAGGPRKGIARHPSKGGISMSLIK